jgi:DNA polymerase-3 subunit delta
MNVRPDRLEAALQKSLAPVYLIAGSEPLIVEECRDAVLMAAQRHGFLERDVYHVDAQFNWDNLASRAVERSLFASRRVIDIRIPTGKPGKEGGAFFAKWAEGPDPERILLVSCGSWESAARKSRWASALAAAGMIVEVWSLRPAELPDWIAGRMRAAGLRAEREAVQLLAELVEGNLLAARQEIEKLSLLHPGAAISVEQVRDAVGNNARFDAFRLGECLLSGRAADSLRVADGLRRTGVAIQAVTGALYYQLSQLDSVRVAIGRGDSEARAFGESRVFKMHQPLMRQALRRLDGGRVGRSFQALSLIDRQSKGQHEGDPWQTLNRMILDLSGEPPAVRRRGWHPR